MYRVKAKDISESDKSFQECCNNQFESGFSTDNTSMQKEKNSFSKLTAMKKIVLVCLINGILWVWCSYILAYLDKVQIAESLSQVAVTEIIGVVFVYAVKSLVENLSKNNKWPDKQNTLNKSDFG